MITEKEHRKLKFLSKAMGLSATRTNFIESEAKAAHCPKAVSEKDAGRAEPAKKASPSKEPAVPACQIRWYGPDETVTVDSYVLQDPMVYVSDGSPNDYEGSCIDLRLEVAAPAPSCAASPALYTFYAQLSPSQRGSYLRWLATGRVGRLDNVWYVLLFLSGLERRLLRERSDAGLVRNEIVRLLETSASSDTLLMQLNGFLVYSLALGCAGHADDSHFELLFEKLRTNRSEDLLVVATAWYCKQRLPLPAAWALAIACRNPLVLNRAVPDEHAGRLRSLFKVRYAEQFGRGLILQVAKSYREIRYRPVNPTLRRAIGTPGSMTKPAMIADVLEQAEQFPLLAALLSRCIEDSVAPSRASVAKPTSIPHQVPAQGPSRGERTITVDGAGVGLPWRAEGRNSAQAAEPSEALGQREPLHRVPDLRWYGSSDSVAVGPYVIKDPMAYMSDGRPREEEASCIDTTLEVGKRAPVAIRTPRLLFHLCRDQPGPARDLSQVARRRPARAPHRHRLRVPVLLWSRAAASCRTAGPEPDRERSRSASGDLYVLGLVRRLSQPVLGVYARASRDRNAQGQVVRRRLRQVAASPRRRLFGRRTGLVLQEKRPAACLLGDPDCPPGPRSPRSVVLDRLSEQFNSLFEKRYHEQFGDGLVLKVSKSDRVLSYRPASPSLLSDFNRSGWSNEPIKIANVLGIQSQFSPLVAIWSSCIEELRPLSRVLAKGIEVDSREAFEALPGELKATVEHPDKQKWDPLVTEHTGEDGCALVESFEAGDDPWPRSATKLTPKQSHALAQTAEYVGLVIEPDARLTNRPYSWDDVVSLFGRRNDRACRPTRATWRRH